MKSRGGVINCTSKGDLLNGATITVQLLEGASWKYVSLSGASGWTKSENDHTFTKKDLEAQAPDNVKVAVQEGNEQRLTIHIGQTIVNSGVQGDLLHGVDVFIRLLGDPLPPEWDDVNVTGSAYSEWNKENANNQYWFHHNATELYNANITIQVEWSGGVTLNISIPVGWDIGVDVEDDLINTAKVNIHLKGMVNWNDVTLVDRATQTLNGWTRKDSGTDHWYEKQDTEAIADETVSIRYQGIEQTSKVVRLGNYSRIITTDDTIIPVQKNVAWLTTQPVSSVFLYTDLTGTSQSIERSLIKALYVDAAGLTLTVNGVFSEFARNCTELTKFSWIPPEGVNNTGELMFAGMFNNCQKLTTLSDNFTFFPHGTITSIKSGFAISAFSQCSSLKTIPNGFSLPCNATASSSNMESVVDSMFYRCTALEKLNDSFTLNFNNTGMTFGASSFSNMFYNCENLKKLPDNFLMPANFNTNDNSVFYNMFSGCAKLEHLPSGFTLGGYTNVLRNSFASGMFARCSKLKDLPINFELPSYTTSIGTNVFYQMFYNCPELTSNVSAAALSIPNVSGSPTNYCYAMFGGTTPWSANGWPTNGTPSPGDQIMISRSQ